MKGIQANAEDAVLVGFNPTNSLSVGGSRIFPFVFGNKTPLLGVPFPFVTFGIMAILGQEKSLGGVV